MKTIDRYLARHFFVALAGTFFMVVLVLLIGEITNISGDILEENPSFWWVVIYLSLVMPGKVAEVVPLGTAVAVLWTLFRFSRQNELLGMFCGGLSPARIAATFLGAAAVMSVGLFVVNESILHATEEAANRVLEVYVKGKKDRGGMTKGGFKQGIGRRFYSIESFAVAEQQMIRPTIVTLAEDSAHPVQRIEADTAELVGEQRKGVWRFINAYVWEFGDNGIPKSLKRHPSIDIKLESDLEKYLGQSSKTREMKLVALIDYIKVMKRRGVPTAELMTDLHLRIAFPLAPFVVTLLVCTFALAPRASRLVAKFGGGLALVALYYVAIVVLRKLGYRDKVPPPVAAWLPNLAFVVVGVIWFFRNSNPWQRFRAATPR